MLEGAGDAQQVGAIMVDLEEWYKKAYLNKSPKVNGFR